ncbi:hypothetical protein ACQP1O_04455 [Nocardia sp. CA-151230]|uniref:hypothetical protein n=1 Tax=Nocardia sp. CA-151230 TaxID=3239982 RepID=UPI003D8AE370
MLPAEERLPDARMYFEFGFYFVVHAPRQSGKTTALLGLARDLTAEGHFLAMSISCETAHVLGDDFAGVEAALLSELRQTAERQGWAPELLPPRRMAGRRAGHPVEGRSGRLGGQMPAPAGSVLRRNRRAAR